MKYKIGDKVKVKSLEWYSENRDKYGCVKCVHENFTGDMSKYCGNVVTIKRFYFSSFYDYTSYNIAEDDGSYTWTDDMFEGLAEEGIYDEEFVNAINAAYNACLDDYNEVPDKIKISQIFISNKNYQDKVELCLGDDYEIVVEDGKTFVQKKKPKYPTTYEECRKVLGIDGEMIVHGGWYKQGLIRVFYKLLICRDAYWKIAGEQMGLGKSWEPEYISLVDNEYFTIHTFNNEIIKSGTSHRNAILSFPTEEMRDAFYDNFKNLVKDCKELL